MNSGFDDSSLNKIENHPANSPDTSESFDIPVVLQCLFQYEMTYKHKKISNYEQNQEIFPNSDFPSASTQDLDFIDPSTSNLRKVCHVSLNQSWNILPPSLSPLCLSYANHCHSNTVLLHVLIGHFEFQPMLDYTNIKVSQGYSSNHCLKRQKKIHKRV